ncbi:MAG: hypothetical protein GC160_18540 [Acidobacteria bacterium]|nr:hypothetical protein [Acidobacteriota bacterium]
MQKPSRREALVTIAAAAAATQACSGDGAAGSSLSAEEVRRLGLALDTILPATDTPGAVGAGVPEMIAYDAGYHPDLLERVRKLLATFDQAGFFDQDAAGRDAVMMAMMDGDEARRAAFEDAKSLAIDYYYSTEVGLAQELGYQGGTYLAEFPGCTDEHLVEGA